MQVLFFKIQSNQDKNLLKKIIILYVSLNIYIILYLWVKDEEKLQDKIQLYQFLHVYNK